MHALGRHLLVELLDCNSDDLNNREAVKRSLLEAARLAQATIVATTFHQSNPFGISGVVVIAESHLSIHTWPEHRYAAVDVFSCGNVLKPDLAAGYLAQRFAAKQVSIVELQRGVFAQSAAPKPRKVADNILCVSNGRWQGRAERTVKQL